MAQIRPDVNMGDLLKNHGVESVVHGLRFAPDESGGGVPAAS